MLSDGAYMLSDGACMLSHGVCMLSDGAYMLIDGSVMLSDGAHTFVIMLSSATYIRHINANESIKVSGEA